MAYETLKNLVAQVVKENSNQEITGALLQQELNRIVDTLGGGRYGFAGVATPSTDPGATDENIFYIAQTPGTYVNFDNYVVTHKGVNMIKRINGSWVGFEVAKLGVYNVGLYLPAPIGPLALVANTNNKVDLQSSEISVPVPFGFDLYNTPQGQALRFIGTGLGNGDTAIISMSAHGSLEVTSGSTNKLIFKAVTRPYTETNFANAVDIPGFAVSRKFPGNDLGAIALVAPPFQVSDGDLIEVAMNPDSAISISVDTFAARAVEFRS